MINLHNITLRRGTKLLLHECSLKINPGEKVALIGKNGVGKSSLFALLTGKLIEDGGILDTPKNWLIAEVMQDLAQTNLNASEFVLQGDVRLTALKHKLQQVEANLAQNPNNVELGIKIAQIHADLTDAGVHDSLSRAQTLILGLGFTPNDLTQSVNSFSGGWRMRLQLARALMCPSDLLLLDEPTNHLDLDALIWLENWLKHYQGTLIVISHDREFLDAIANITIHLENAHLTSYKGNYSQFELQLAQKMELQQSSYVKQQAKIAHLQSFIDRFQYKATKAKQAQSRIKQIERMQKIAPILVSSSLSFEFAEIAQVPNPMLSLQECDLGYKNNGESNCILRKVSCNVLPLQRIGILGANGQGKSTLIKSITGQLDVLSGQIVLGKGLKIGYFAQQELDILKLDQNPLQHMLSVANSPNNQTNVSEQTLRSHLGKFNFSGEILKQQVSSLSGGEKARLVLAIIVWQKPNLLLLDEPTNHLDLDTRDALAQALNNFNGTMMLVSHDRALLRSVCDEFWLVENGKVTEFNGDLEDYQQYVLEQKRQKINIKNNERSSSYSKKHGQERSKLEQQLRALRKEQTIAEQELGRLQNSQQNFQKQFIENTANVDLAQVGRELKEGADKIEKLEHKWLELEEQITNLEAN